jgi:hypothetical protein
MTPQRLRRKIAQLQESQSVTARFEAAIVGRKSRKRDPWYGSQKEHWLGWLKEYDGPGYYGRQSWGVSAEAVYNRVVNPSMVLWLGEAAGVSQRIVEAAAEAALAGKPSMAAQSGAIRRLIPWSMIADCLT